MTRKRIYIMAIAVAVAAIGVPLSLAARPQEAPARRKVVSVYRPDFTLHPPVAKNGIVTIVADGALAPKRRGFNVAWGLKVNTLREDTPVFAELFPRPTGVPGDRETRVDFGYFLAAGPGTTLPPGKYLARVYLFHLWNPREPLTWKTQAILRSEVFEVR